MKSRILFSALAATLFALQSSIAGELSIGVIDAKIVETKALVVNDIATKSKNTFNKIQSDTVKKEKELQKEVQEMEKKRSVLSEAALLDMQKALQQKVINWQEEIRMQNEAIEQAKMESLAKVDEIAKNIVDKLAESKKLDLVMSSQALLFKNPDVIIDITEDFVTDLNKTVSKSEFDELFKKFSSSRKK